jgi:hypothetical protein
MVLLQLATPCANAAFYQWTDAKGVEHFTDNRDKIPKRYLKKARKLETSAEPAPAKDQAPGPQAPQLPSQAPAQLSGPQSSGAGGHSEPWWRQRFAELRGDLKALEDGLSRKQEKLVELRRKRAIFVRIKDREAVNAMQDEISADEVCVNELRKRIEALEQEAAREGVPAEWRR